MRCSVGGIIQTKQIFSTVPRTRTQMRKLDLEEVRCWVRRSELCVYMKLSVVVRTTQVSGYFVNVECQWDKWVLEKKIALKLTLEDHDLFCRFSWTFKFLVVPLYFYSYICHLPKWHMMSTYIGALSSFVFIMTQLVSVTSFSLGLLLFYSVANIHNNRLWLLVLRDMFYLRFSPFLFCWN
jgi:hypothetical protein